MKNYLKDMQDDNDGIFIELQGIITRAQARYLDGIHIHWMKCLSID